VSGVQRTVDLDRLLLTVAIKRPVLLATRHDCTEIIFDDITGEKNASKYVKYSEKLRYDKTGGKETSLL
jgi:hypothetical protein